MELTASELWSRILEAVKAALPEQSFRTWLAATTPVALSEEELLVEAPSDFHVEWIEDKYGPLLGQAARRILGRPLRLSFRSGEGFEIPSVPSVEVAPPPAPPSPDPFVQIPGPGLNGRYTFERFVVGAGNELAAAAARAVADRPALVYNPLFLYGGVGLGKTHLMHAIGNHVRERDPSLRVGYISSEEFMNDLVTSIQEGRTAEFRRRYRRMDLLLVDDIHFLEGKERTQDEFFHTFNALYDAQKQIVVTSDRPPKELPGLEERLVSRFEWGLVADLKPPDFETRVAILRKKAEDDGLQLDPEIIEYIARACTHSVRELEGAVIKLLAYSSLRHQEITLELARTALEGMIRQDGRAPGDAPSPEEIREAVARAWGLSPRDLMSKRRTREVTIPRQVAMYLLREILHLPLSRIGDLFGGRDHSTVIHSIRKVEEELRGEPEVAERIRRIRQELGLAREG